MLEFFNSVGLGHPILVVLLFVAATTFGAWLRHSFERTSKISEEFRREYTKAATGLLEAYASAARGDPTAAIDFAYWEAVLALYASQNTRDRVTQLKESAPGSDRRSTAQESMLNSMRSDLVLR